MNLGSIMRFVPLRLLRGLARLLARLAWRMPNLKLCQIIDINLRLVYPDFSDTERQQKNRQIIQNQFLSVVESVKSWAMPPAWSVKQIQEVHHFDILQKALNNPNGMLAIVPHLGTWEMMNAWLNQFGSPTIMYKPIKGDWANEFVLQGRQRLNATLVPTDATGVKAIFKTLKNGGFSIILPDHVPEPPGGVVVPFFNIPTLSSTLAPKLASKTQCALVGLACIRREDGQGFDVHCYDLNDPKLFDTDIEMATLALNQAMQSIINDFTDHYMWSYKRFKFVPNVDEIYTLNPHELAKLSQKYAPQSIKTPNPTQ